MSPNGLEIVVPSQAQILPCFLVTFHPPGSEIVNRPLATSDKKEQKETTNPLLLEKRAHEKAEWEARTLAFHRLPGTIDQWILDLSQPALAKLERHYGMKFAGKSQVHMYLILDRSRSMGSAFQQVLLPACARDSCLHSACAGRTPCPP